MSCAARRRSAQTAAHVLGILADGGYARHLVVPESALFPVPEGLSDVDAAVMHCTFGTAYRDLKTLGGLAPGERVLITGANGGVGTAAIQVAVRLGAEVVAVVRDERHRAFLEELGAHEVVVDSGDGFHRAIQSVDLALDTVGAATFNAALRSLRIGGRIVVIGNITPEKVQLNLGYIITQGLLDPRRIRGDAPRHGRALRPPTRRSPSGVIVASARSRLLPRRRGPATRPGRRAPKGASCSSCSPD